MWQILTNLIEFGLFFLDPKYPNATRPENYGYFICILIIDLNWPGSEKNRSQPKLKNLQVPIESKCLRPEEAGPERNRPKPDPKTQMSMPSSTCLDFSGDRNFSFSDDPWRTSISLGLVISASLTLLCRCSRYMFEHIWLYLLASASAL